MSRKNDEIDRITGIFGSHIEEEREFGNEGEMWERGGNVRGYFLLPYPPNPLILAFPVFLGREARCLHGASVLAWMLKSGPYELPYRFR